MKRIEREIEQLQDSSDIPEGYIAHTAFEDWYAKQDPGSVYGDIDKPLGMAHAPEWGKALKYRFGQHSVDWNQAYQAVLDVKPRDFEGALRRRRAYAQVTGDFLRAAKRAARVCTRAPVQARARVRTRAILT